MSSVAFKCSLRVANVHLLKLHDGISSYFQDIEAIKSTPPSFSDSYVALFVRMLGLDYDQLDREQAIVALWKYSLGGKKYIDAIMQFPGCINLTLNLLRSESTSTCEAAAGLLRSISSVNLYRELVAESGAIEEITGLLSRPSLIPEVYTDFTIGISVFLSTYF